MTKAVKYILKHAQKRTPFRFKVVNYRILLLYSIIFKTVRMQPALEDIA